MKRFFAVLLVLLGINSSINAQEHSPAKTSPRVQTASPKRTPGYTRRRTSATRRRRSSARRVPTSRVPKKVVPPVANVLPAFTSPEGRFSVLMPGTPTDKTETVDSEPEPYTTHMFISRDDPQRVYLVGWVDYHPSFNFNRLAELEANRDNFVKGVSAKLLSSHRLNIDGYQALEFTAENAEMIFKSRVYIVGRRPYQIVIGSPKGIDDSAAVDQFFKSFKVSLR
jgi:hypothetical protein